MIYLFQFLVIYNKKHCDNIKAESDPKNTDLVFETV